MAGVTATGNGRANRGPSAAAANRAALIDAARRVFAESGYGAPLSAVAREAGVGQGSLYRHFPHRSDLALAVFDDNIAEIERLAAHPDSTLADVLQLITEQALVSTALIHILTTSDDPHIEEKLGGRLRALLEPKVAQAHATGSIRPELTVDDIETAIVMVSGAVSTSPAAERREVAARGWRLIGLDGR